jgi:hypothetical protein
MPSIDRKPDSGESNLPRPAPLTWADHLRSLVGQPVTAVTMWSHEEFHGKLLAIEPDHMRCAIETDAEVLTLKNVQHIVSLKQPTFTRPDHWPEVEADPTLSGGGAAWVFDEAAANAFLRAHAAGGGL